jgi:flagellar biosynthetic protein FliQ
MEQALALDTARQAIQVGLLVSLPILATALFIGLIISVLQAITQIQEATLTFVPKVLALAAVIVLLGNWMLLTLVQFCQFCFTRAGNLGLQ